MEYLQCRTCKRLYPKNQIVPDECYKWGGNWKRKAGQCFGSGTYNCAKIDDRATRKMLRQMERKDEEAQRQMADKGFNWEDVRKRQAQKFKAEVLDRK